MVLYLRMLLMLLLLFFALTHAGQWAGRSLANPDQIAYTTRGEAAFTDLYLYDVATGVSIPITNNEGPERELVWSPDGSLLAYSTGLQGARQVVMSGAYGENPRVLSAENADNYGPTWSPDSHELAYLSIENRRHTVQISGVADANRREFADVVQRDLQALRWSPRGGQFALRYDQGVESYVLLLDAETGEPGLRGDGSTTPSWSPTGDAFVTTYLGGSARYPNGLVVVDAQTGDVTPLSTDLFDVVTGASWSPAGDRIAFTASLSNGSTDVYVVDADGANLHALTRTPYTETGPLAWSPDGSRLAYERRDDDGGRICIVVVTDAQVTCPPALVRGFTPVWRPR